jgi:hypothetical protein
MDAGDSTFRRHVLAAFGAAGAVADELLTYNGGVPARLDPAARVRLPLPPEPHLEAWEAYAAEARIRGAWAVLEERLVQLRFPVREGISQSEAYRRATRQGLPPDDPGGLGLRDPGRLRLWVHASLAGPVPVLHTPDRGDFELLVQALSARNEPEPVPASMGACIVAGFNNWDRVHRYRRQWEEEDPAHALREAWDEEFRRLVPRKELYQDRFLILSDGPYSNVSAEELGLSPEEWGRLSLAIRLQHECTHYLTLRLFGHLGDCLLDEVAADYAGLVAACGHYRADWFLRFVGLEAFPRYRKGGRLENYRGRPPLSDEAFAVLQALVQSAAENLQRLDSAWGPADRAPLVLALCCSTVEELASEQAGALLRQRAEALAAPHPLLPSRNSPTDVSA